jgi:cytochrome subunit of sulfide dehydrogenase
MNVASNVAAGVLAVMIALPSSATAQSNALESQPPYLTGTCTNCHGTQGRSAGAMPSLAGLPPGYLIEQMKQFREGKRPATIMHEIAKAYSDDQMALLADYFARQSPAR